MRYMVITADYRSTGIKDEFGSWLSNDELHVSDELWLRLSDWVKRYERIVPMDSKQREQELEIIRELDQEGLRIMGEFLACVGPDVKIKYYSEGLLKFIGRRGKGDGSLSD